MASSSSASSSNYTYAVLQETNGKEYESWLYFIRYEGNEEALRNLRRQMDMVEDWYILDDLSTFELELDHRVSATTAKEMTRLVLNHVSNHRKFDGKLEPIDIGIKDKDSNDRRLVRFFKKLGIGRIQDFIDNEDEATFSECSDDDAMEDSSDSSGTEYEYGLSDSETESDEEAMVESPPRAKRPTSNPAKATVDRIKEEIKAKQAAKAQREAENKRRK